MDVKKKHSILCKTKKRSSNKRLITHLRAIMSEQVCLLKNCKKTMLRNGNNKREKSEINKRNEQFASFSFINCNFIVYKMLRMLSESFLTSDGNEIHVLT